MERIVFKNMYVNVAIGFILVLGAVLGYLFGWIEDFLPIVIAIILLFLTIRRFVYSITKKWSKKASFILVGEFVLDLVFCGLLIYLQDHINIFVGLVVYTRGVAYLIINYITARKIELLQYILNIGYVTLGSFLMFGPWDSAKILLFGVLILMGIVGAIFIQSGIVKIVAKEEAQEALEKIRKEEVQEALLKMQEEETNVRIEVVQQPEAQDEESKDETED